jgi:rubrerythrin
MAITYNVRYDNSSGSSNNNFGTSNNTWVTTTNNGFYSPITYNIVEAKPKHICPRCKAPTYGAAPIKCKSCGAKQELL